MRRITLNSPIFRAKTRHHYERIPRSRRYHAGILWFGAAVTALSTLIPLGNPVKVADISILIALALAVYGFHAVVIIRTLGLASTRFAPQLEPTRWTLLALTNLSSGHILQSHWRAIMQKVWFWHVMAAVLKLGFAAGVAQHIDGMVTSQQCSGVYQQLGMCYRLFSSTYSGYPLDLSYKLIFAITLLLALGIGEAALSAAAGILGAILNRGALKTVLGLGIFVSVIGICGAAFLSLIIVIDAAYPDTIDIYDIDWFTRLNLANTLTILRMLSLSLMSIVDGGTYAITLLFRPYEGALFYSLRILAFGFVSVVGLLSLTWLTWRISEAMLVRQGASSPKKNRWWEKFYFRSWTHAGLIKAQRLTLLHRRENQWVLVLSLLLFAIALAIASLPRWVYIDNTRAEILVFIAFAVGSAYLIVSLRTLIVSIESVAREQRLGAWDLLRLTNLRPTHLIFSKWWSVFRWALPSHLMIVVLQLGLAYGIAQYLHVIPMPDTRALFSAFRYISHNCGFMGNIAPECYGYISPNIPRVLMGAGSLLTIAISNAALTSAIGIFAASLVKKGAAAQFVIAATLRILPLVLSLAFMLASADENLALLRLSRNSRWNQEGEIRHVEALAWLRILESLQVSASTHVDGGVLASVNFMRAFDYHLGIYYLLRAALNVFLGAIGYLIFAYILLRLSVLMINPPMLIWKPAKALRSRWTAKITV